MELYQSKTISPEWKQLNGEEDDVKRIRRFASAFIVSHHKANNLFNIERSHETAAVSVSDLRCFFQGPICTSIFGSVFQ